jgi:hypothetical protein
MQIIRVDFGIKTPPSPVISIFETSSRRRAAYYPDTQCPAFPGSITQGCIGEYRAVGRDAGQPVMLPFVYGRWRGPQRASSANKTVTANSARNLKTVHRMDGECVVSFYVIFIQLYPQKLTRSYSSRAQ